MMSKFKVHSTLITLLLFIPLHTTFADDSALTATEEITQKIESIQGSTHNTVQTMGSITKVIEQIHDVKSVINEVIAKQTNVAGNIDDLVRETKSAAQVMIQSIEDVKAGALGSAKQ